jgi:hypothetical protein
MAYRAKQLCRFDKVYLVGEIIPDQVILPSRIPALIEMGAIEVAPKSKRKSTSDGPISEEPTADEPTSEEPEGE